MHGSLHFTSFRFAFFTFTVHRGRVLELWKRRRGREAHLEGHAGTSWAGVRLRPEKVWKGEYAQRQREYH